MKFIQTHDTGIDSTAPYDVIDIKAETVIDFINEVLSETPNNFGDFLIKDNRRKYEYQVSYQRGEIVETLPACKGVTLDFSDMTEEIKKSKFDETVKAFGGYSMMNYYLEIN